MYTLDTTPYVNVTYSRLNKKKKKNKFSAFGGLIPCSCSVLRLSVSANPKDHCYYDILVTEVSEGDVTFDGVVMLKKVDLPESYGEGIAYFLYNTILK